MEVEALTEIEILQPETFAYLLDLESEVEKVELQEQLEKKAGELGVDKAFKKRLKAYKTDSNKVNKYTPTRDYGDLVLKYTEKGNVANTIGNFVSIIEHDFKGRLKFNLVSNSFEFFEKDGEFKEWQNEHESNIKNYIESKYGIHSETKFSDAIMVVFSKNKYNPLTDLIESVKWDGVSRIGELLIKYMGADDTSYSRECSRLIFAGGIHRMYNPGCKFDDMIVLVGSNQGGGKSTIVRWLALQDKYFSEVKEIEGQRAIDTLQGSWICEVSELLALTKIKEVEAAKSFITAQSDKYRTPWDKFPTTKNRKCIFVGTSNKEQFLTDKTGNRRYYPVIVNSIGYELYDHEQEIRDYIAQCWAEALALYKDGKLPPFANKELQAIIKSKQNEAVEDDYREGMIQAYLENKVKKAEFNYDKVCVIEIWEDCFLENMRKPTRRDSNDIALILGKMDGWTRTGKSARFVGYGMQKYWQYEEIPF